MKQALRFSDSLGYSAIAVAPAEAARLAGVGRSTLYLALKSGALPSIKLGKRRLIRVDALEAWLDSHAEV